MRHESISVIYDSSLAIADEIADKLGAQTLSVQSLTLRCIESCHSFILGIEFMSDDDLTPRWLYGFQMLLSQDLKGKVFAVYVASGNHREHVVVKGICDMLKERGARIISDILYIDSSQGKTIVSTDRPMMSTDRPMVSTNRLDDWIGTISPNI